MGKEKNKELKNLLDEISLSLKSIIYPLENYRKGQHAPFEDILLQVKDSYNNTGFLIERLREKLNLPDSETTEAPLPENPTDNNNPEPSKPNGNDYNVLIAEDSEDYRIYIRFALSGKFNITEAEDGAEALERARENIPDLIVSDVLMPRMDGLSFLKEVRNDTELSSVPFILLSAKSSVDDKIAGLDNEADDYIAKPFNPRELAARVMNLIELRRKLFRDLGRQAAKAGPPAENVSTADKEFLEMIADSVKKNYSSPNYNVDTLADSAYLSVRQLTRKLKELTGVTPGDFIRAERLKSAREMIEKKAHKTVSEIAYSAGFTNPKYFSRLYKQVFDISPAELLKS